MECGQHGHLSALSSGTAIASYFNEQLASGQTSSLPAEPRPSAREISKAVLQGDRLAIETFKRAAYYMGIGLANYLHLLTPRSS